MKALFAALRGLAVLAFIAGAAPCATAADREVLERWDFSFDAHEWQLGYQAANRLQEIREYVLPGETVDGWSELVTSFYSKGLVEPRDAFEQTRNDLSRGCPSFQSAIIEETKDSIFFEWRHDGCQGFPAQHELRRISTGRKGVHSLSFVEKTNELTAEKRDAWVAIISGATIRTKP